MQTKLTEAQVAEILSRRDKLDKDGLHYYGVDVAQEFNISPSMVSRIWTGQRRKKREKK